MDQQDEQQFSVAAIFGFVRRREGKAFGASTGTEEPCVDFGFAANFSCQMDLVVDFYAGTIAVPEACVCICPSISAFWEAMKLQVVKIASPGLVELCTRKVCSCRTAFSANEKICKAVRVILAEMDEIQA